MNVVKNKTTYCSSLYCRYEGPGGSNMASCMRPLYCFASGHLIILRNLTPPHAASFQRASINYIGMSLSSKMTDDGQSLAAVMLWRLEFGV